jgi:hypothetical protein
MDLTRMGTDSAVSERAQSIFGQILVTAAFLLVLLVATACRVENSPPPAEGGTPQGQGCNANYAGACLDSNASDYDCAGGSGNGPEYTGPVQVVGYDEYGLDSDGDGIGCE